MSDLEQTLRALDLFLQMEFHKTSLTSSLTKFDVVPITLTTIYLYVHRESQEIIVKYSQKIATRQNKIPLRSGDY